MENVVENIIENTPKKPERLSLILSAIALLGVIVLLIFQFTDNDDAREIGKDVKMPMLSTGSNTIVFVNTDDLLKNYKLVPVLTEQLEQERKRKDADFSAKQKSYQDDAAYFQSQVEKQAISEASAQQIYEKLMLQQQDLYNLQDQYTAELSKKEFEMNMTLLDSVKNYLHRLNKNYNYDYILSSNNTGNILLAKDTFDITNQVLEGLNKEYTEKFNPQK
jgi:outer membrane protein